MATVTDVQTIEAVGDRYSFEQLMSVRARTRRAVHMIANQVVPGMMEEEAKEIARTTLESLGMRRGWHHIIVRCGRNTTKDFMARSEPKVVLRDNDIFFVDIGPIYEGCEGDAGDTFVFGDNPDHHRAKHDARAIWEDVRETWFEQHITGQQLYKYATTLTEERGWKLNMDLSGHRLSEFPHSAHYDGPLADVGFRPNPNLWVLEIAIAHPNGSFGAFYEDLLLEDQSFPEGTIPGG
jgi:methionyl aminopeptidase